MTSVRYHGGPQNTIRTRGGHGKEVTHEALFKYQGVMGRLCIQVQNNSYPGNFGYVFDVNRKLSDKMHTKLKAMVTLAESFLLFGLFISLAFDHFYN